MIGCGIACLVSLGIGFALGRVKNAAKLKAVENELDKLENYGVEGYRIVLDAIKAHLHLK